MQSDENNGLVLYGLEFVEPSSVARMAIARFTGRLTEDPMPNDEMGLPGLPPPVALQLKTARHDGLTGGVAVSPAPTRTAVQAPRQLPTHIVMHR
jgi:hypothetical protein